MNNRDKIEALKRQLILHPSYLTIIEEIEKDLEVLEKIKKEAIIQEHYKKGYGRYYTVGIEEFFNKIKEWLEID